MRLVSVSIPSRKREKVKKVDQTDQNYKALVPKAPIQKLRATYKPPLTPSKPLLHVIDDLQMGQELFTPLIKICALCLSRGPPQCIREHCRDSVADSVVLEFWEMQLPDLIVGHQDLNEVRISSVERKYCLVTCPVLLFPLPDRVNVPRERIKQILLLELRLKLSRFRNQLLNIIHKSTDRLCVLNVCYFM